MNIIDIHTHGIGGYDTRRATEEAILKMAEIHGASGVSAILPTIYPDTIQVMRENMMVVKRTMDIQRSKKQIPPSTAAILGIHLEGPFLNPAKCGALNAAIFIEPMEHHLDE